MVDAFHSFETTMTLLRRAARKLLATTALVVGIGAGAALLPSVMSSLLYVSQGFQALAAEGNIEELVRREVERQMRPMIKDVVEKASPVAIEKWIRENPEKVAESLNAMIAKHQQAAADDANAKVHAIDDILFNAEVPPVLGNPKGRIEIVYFFDANCGYCKLMEPRMAKLVAENPDVKIIHREIGILGEGSNHAAHFEAGVWTRDPKRYPALHAKVMSRKQPFKTREDVEAFMKAELGDKLYAEISKGIDAIDADPIYAITNISSNLASMAGIQGTPFIYVKNGEMFRGAVDDQALAAAVAKARETN